METEGDMMLFKDCLGAMGQNEGEKGIDDHD